MERSMAQQGRAEHHEALLDVRTTVLTTVPASPPPALGGIFAFACPA